MAGPVLVAPGVVDAASPEDARRIDEWAHRARAELTRLALAVRTVEAKAARAELDAEASSPARPDTLLSVVDATLATAGRKAQEAVESARREADTVVGVAARLAADVVREAGIDPVTVESIRPRRSALAARAAIVPSGDELWDRIVDGRDAALDDGAATVDLRAAGAEVVPADGPSGGAPVGDEPVAVPAPAVPAPASNAPAGARPAPEWVADADRSAADPQVDPVNLPKVRRTSPPPADQPAPPASTEPSATVPRGAPSPTATVLTGAPTAAGGEDAGARDGSGTPDAARVYEMFWARVPDNHPVRARLRLRPARGR